MILIDGNISMPLFSQQLQNRKPLVSFSNRERANLAVSEPPMPKKIRRRASTRSATARRKRRGTVGSNKIRVVGGRVRLRVTGYQGFQSLAPSALVRFIPATKLRLAARKVLKTQHRFANRKRRTVKRKRRKTRSAQ